jgi:hypothetical protein
MSKAPQEIKVFITRDIPAIGIDLLKKKDSLYPFGRMTGQYRRMN